MAKRKRGGREDYKLVKRIQCAAYAAASEISHDEKLVSYALMELALLIVTATRPRTITKLEHRDHLVEAVQQMHEHAWDDTAAVYEKIRECLE